MTKQPLPQSITTAGANLPKAKWAKGSYIHDANGKRYIDGSSGPAVYCIGHGNEEVNAAIADQLIAGRPYGSSQAFLAKLAGLVSATDAQQVFVDGDDALAEAVVYFETRVWRGHREGPGPRPDRLIITGFRRPLRGPLPQARGLTG